MIRRSQIQKPSYTRRKSLEDPQVLLYDDLADDYYQNMWVSGNPTSYPLTESGGTLTAASSYAMHVLDMPFTDGVYKISGNAYIASGGSKDILIQLHRFRYPGSVDQVIPIQTYIVNSSYTSYLCGWTAPYGYNSGVTAATVPVEMYVSDGLQTIFINNVYKKSANIFGIFPLNAFVWIGRGGSQAKDIKVERVWSVRTS